MSLKDKFECVNAACLKREPCPEYHMAIYKTEYEEAIKFYWDAVEHPEKYPELIIKFMGEKYATETVTISQMTSQILLIKRLTKEINIAGYEDLFYQIRWRDFLSEYFIGKKEE